MLLKSQFENYTFSQMIYREITRLNRTGPFVCLVFEQGGNILTLLALENLVVKCNHQTVASRMGQMQPNLSRLPRL